MKTPEIFLITTIGNYEVKISQKYDHFFGQDFLSLCIFITPKDCLNLSFFRYICPTFGLRNYECEVSDELILVNEISCQNFNSGEKSLLARIPFILLDKVTQEFKDCLKIIPQESEFKVDECLIILDDKIRGELHSSRGKNHYHYSGFSVDSGEIAIDVSKWMFSRRSLNHVPLNLFNIVITEIINGMNINFKHLIKEIDLVLK